MTPSNSYYSNVNAELLNICPEVERVLEFGCGEGNLLASYKAKYPAADCVGLELFETAANAAMQRVDHVIVGNAETISLEEVGYSPEYFDLLLYGDVLEHLVDPWRALESHVKSLRPGGWVCACIPNVSHWSIMARLVNGNFDYENSGLLDRTHLRFFSKPSIIKMMRGAGLEIELIRPRAYQTEDTDIGIRQFARLFGKPIEQIDPQRIEDWSTYQYLVRARKPLSG